MAMEKQKSFLTVAPFECAWKEELRFREAGRGCIVFEAFAQNDVTLVFREQLGSQHYHYKMDNSAHYTVILGSHRNKRLKIEVDGKTVVDVAGIGLCCSSSFQSYWVSIYDGLISIGRGRNPLHNIVFQWLDLEPNYNVQYVGLCSWDKHVGYRKISVFSIAPHNNTLWSHIDYRDYEDENEPDEGLEELNDGFKMWGLANFLENWDLSDVMFVVGMEKKAVPAHKIILNSAGNFPTPSDDCNVISLPSVSYAILHALLEYIYTGHTQITEQQIDSLCDLSICFGLTHLTKHCKEIADCFRTNKKLLDSGTKVEIGSNSFQIRPLSSFPFKEPIDVKRLRQYLSTGEHSDVNIHIEMNGLVLRLHKIVLSLWSLPFSKMFTNGMMESNSMDIHLQDVCPEAFSLLIQFMYDNKLKVDDTKVESLLVELLLLADRFNITVLQRECLIRILESLSEDTICPVLRAVSGVSSCKLVEEACKRNFALHFDYCTTASKEFILLEEATFKDILQHPDMTVTSEEKVLDAIFVWCAQDPEILGWASVDKLLDSSTCEHLFSERLHSLDVLLCFVRFPLLASQLLQMIANSRIAAHIPSLQLLVEEAVCYSVSRSVVRTANRSERYQHRRSSFKELQYICDGDNNGVIYYTGTSYREHRWVNPVLAKKITVTASSPASRYTDPKALVSRSYQGTCFAGPRIVDGKNCSWWAVDLCQDHQLICNYYTIRQDGSTTFMRSWVFQGSVDGENWANLKIHDNDQTICRPAQFASWAVNGPSALLPYRFFRILLTAPAAGYSNVWNLSICFLELYGFFR